MAEEIPYAEIIERADRRWTARLLERLSVADERGNAVRALQAVSDPRSFAPLEAVVADTALPPPVRQAASEALFGMHTDWSNPPAATLRHWWATGDEMLARHALRFMGGLACPDIVVQVASDAAHPLQADALSQMADWFDTPAGEAVKISALAHPRFKVRVAAADVLRWDEPLAAQSPLLAATGDPVSVVAAVAANTLRYYPSLAVLRGLDSLRGHADRRVTTEAERSFQAIRDEIQDALRTEDRRAADHLRRWLAPAWDLLAFSADELQPIGKPVWPRREESRRLAIPFDEVLARIQDADTASGVLGDLHCNDWPGYTVEERSKLRGMLSVHADPGVRAAAAQAFGAWEDAQGLLELLADEDFGVRKSAMLYLGRLPRQPGLASVAWESLERGAERGMHLTEALSTFAAHAAPAEAACRLAAMALDSGQRECLRNLAVRKLHELGEAEALAQIGGLLLEPPAVTWAIHLSLLDAFSKLALPIPSLAALRDADNLAVQKALANAGA